MNINSRLGICILIIFGLLLMAGCATTGKNYKTAGTNESGDIDQLLGIGDKATDGEINEDDVLKLLGVSDETQTGSSGSSSEQALASTENAEPQVSTQNMPASGATSKQESAFQQNRLPSDQSALGKTDRILPSFKTDSYFDRYQEALQAYRAKNFREAIQKFEALLVLDTRHSLSDNCQYWIGESYYDLQNYQQAIVAFEKVFTYSKSNKDDSAQLKLGMCYLKLNEKEKAKEEFQKLLRDYPASEYISIAKRFIDQIGGPVSSP